MFLFIFVYIFRSLLQESTHSNIHLVRLTRLLRLARLLQKMDRYSQYSAVILTMLMLFFIVVAHWLACIWYVIAEKERLRNDKDWDLGKSLGASTSALCLQVTPCSATWSVVELLREMRDAVCMKVARLPILFENTQVFSISIQKQFKDGLRDL